MSNITFCRKLIIQKNMEVEKYRKILTMKIEKCIIKSINHAKYAENIIFIEKYRKIALLMQRGGVHIFDEQRTIQEVDQDSIKIPGLVFGNC